MNDLVDKNFLKSVIDTVPDPLLVIDRQYRVLFMNQAARKIAPGLGNAEKVLCHVLTHNSDRPCHENGEICPVRDAIVTGQPQKCLHRHPDPDGGEEIYEITATPVLDEQGLVVKVVEVLRNVSHSILFEQLLAANARVEEAQRELLARHEDLNHLFKHVEVAKRQWEISVDCIRDIVIMIDENEAIIRMNKAFSALSGKHYLEVLGCNWQLVLREMFDIPGNLAIENRLNLRHAATGKEFAFSHYTYQEDLLGISGKVISLQDITDQREIQNRLEKTNREIDEHRQKLNEALARVSDLIQQVARQEDFSVRFENLTLANCWQEMECGKTSCPCYGQEGLRCWQTAGTYCRGQIQGFFAEKYKDCANCRFFQKVTDDPIMEIGEQFNNMMHILDQKNRELLQVNDELKATLQILEKNSEELSRANTQLKNTQSQILQQEKMASIGVLAAGVAHEINNPIGFVSSNLGSLARYVERLKGFVDYQTGLLETMEDNDKLARLGEERKRLKIDRILADLVDLINESLEGVERVRKIVLNLKSFSRVDQADYKQADINECMESTVNIVWNELKYKARVTKEYGELPPTMCYPQQLNQVFMNLLVNAAQAIDKQGEIVIRTRVLDGFILAAVADTGSGIPEKNLSKLFEPFFTTKDVGKGTGLGLSIAYDIVKKHQGEIEVQSEVGVGSTFTVKIPVVEKNND